MRNLTDRLGEVRALATRDLSDEQIDRTISRGRQRHRQKRRNRAAIAALLLLVTGGVGWFQLSARPSMTFADGSTADMLGSESVLRVIGSSPQRVEVAMDRGRSRFDVVRNPKRTFRVVSGDVTIEVVGTRFLVERRERDVLVEVDRGKVRVLYSGGERLLTPGESGTFPLHAAASNDVAELPSPELALEPTPASNQATPPDEPAPTGNRHKNWRAIAEQGNYEAAYQEIRAGGEHAMRDVPEELMLAADVARWSHHSQAAIPLLQRVIRDHRRDPRCQLAAFTLGRVYLEELGRPREAAQAFAQARTLDPAGPLANDALAHEVESWSRTGDLRLARTRAEEYLRTYPSGAHAAAVRRFGAIE
jgi:transmembrane sensor